VPDLFARPARVAARVRDKRRPACYNPNLFNGPVRLVSLTGMCGPAWRAGRPPQLRCIVWENHAMDDEYPHPAGAPGIPSPNTGHHEVSVAVALMRAWPIRRRVGESP